MEIIESMFEKLYSCWNILVVKGWVLLTVILTWFMSAIGYPKQIILFVIVLAISDILTRWYAEVKIAYGNFTLINFFNAWKSHVLNSKKLKSGLFAKIFFYSILLYIAHQSSVVEELYFGETISNTVYSTMIVLDAISIGENMLDAGYSKAQEFVDFFINIKNKIFNDK